MPLFVKPLRTDASIGIDEKSLVRNTQQFAFAAASGDDEIRLHLGDIQLPPPDTEMKVEGFKPTLLSRLLDLVMPLR